MNAIKPNSSLQSIFQIRNSKKQHPTYLDIIKELNEKHYEKAESLCKDFLNFFPKSYSLRCILAYIYRCLKNYEQAHLYLKEAINLKPKEPIAYLIREEVFFWQNEYKEAANYLEKSVDCKAKIKNLHIILGNNYLLNNYYEEAEENYNIALKNDPNNYLCLKNCAFSICKKSNYYILYNSYSNALAKLDKFLNINNEDSLILCYFREILCSMRQYGNAISYFTKANIIDPENIHNLYKRAIAYYIIQEYNEALSDLNKVIQFDSLNSLAYYLKCLIYYTKKDINNAITEFNKCTELLDSDDNILAKTQLYHLEYLLNKYSSKYLIYNILTKINQVPNIKNIYNIGFNNANTFKLLVLIRCKIYMELKLHYEAKLDLDFLYKHSSKKPEFLPYIYLLQKYMDFWIYYTDINSKFHYIKDYSKFGIIDEFSKYMYVGKRIFNLLISYIN
jgi:tetratricopeptide (TPR) repeat protein